MANLNELKELLNSMVNGIGNFLSECKNERINAHEEFIKAKDNLVKATATHDNACDMVINSLSKIVESGKTYKKECEPYVDMVGEIVDVVDDYAEPPTEDEDDDDNETEYVVGTCDNCGCDIYDNDEFVENENGMFCCETCADEYESEEHEDEEE